MDDLNGRVGTLEAGLVSPRSHAAFENAPGACSTGACLPRCQLVAHLWPANLVLPLPPRTQGILNKGVGKFMRKGRPFLPDNDLTLSSRKPFLPCNHPDDVLHAVCHASDSKEAIARCVLALPWQALFLCGQALVVR